MTTLSAAAMRAALRREAPRTVPEWRVLRRKWSKQLASRSGHDVVRLAVDLVDDSPWTRVTAYELITNHRGAIAALTPATLRQLGRGLADWVSVDTFACYVAGPAWREGRLPTTQINSWLRSDDRWERRLAVACTVALNVRSRGGTGDARRTLAVCRQVVNDRDDMVVKALSWALRSLVEWDRDAVSGFLREHAGDLAGRVKREVGTKLRTGRKNEPVARRAQS